MNDRDGLLRKARKSKNNDDWKNYKAMKNHTNNSINRAKTRYHKELLKENISKPETFWKHIKTLFPTKSVGLSPKSIIIDDCQITNESEIANGFCSFFNAAVRNLKIKSIKLKDFIWSFPKNLPIITGHRFSFRYVSVPEITRILKEVNSKKSAGPDQIPARLINDCANELASPIAHLINVILETSVIPSDFKIGRISAIYKNGEKTQLNNYRPITVLPIISKIMERCVFNQLTDYFERNNLLSHRQFGFRKGRSTELAATFFFDEVHKAMDKGQLTGTLFIDLSKAFDTVSHAALLNKLDQFGICNQEKAFFVDYLFNRWQYVQYKSASSTSQPVYNGVPQGSILGPLLFIIHFNDAEQQLIKCKMITYADDTIIYFHSNDIKAIERTISAEFTYLSNWLTDNELILNMNKGKTEIMIFGTQKRLAKADLQLNIMFQSTTVNSTCSYKYLGIEVDPSLNLCAHFQHVYKTASSRLRLLRRIRPYLTKTAAIRIYEAFILSKIMYCSLTNYFHQPYRQDLLSSLESRAKGIVNTGDKFPSIKQKQKKKVCKLVRECLDGRNDIFYNYFHVIRHEKRTRNNNCLLRIPKIKLESTKKSFYFNGVLTYNLLPYEIRLESNFNVFKKKLNNFNFT